MEWEQGLSESFIFKDKKPVRYSPSDDPDVSAAANEQTVARQRFTLITWYRSCRMALHRQYLTFPGAEQSRPPPSNSIIADLSSSASRLIKDMCVRLSKDLIRLELSCGPAPPLAAPAPPPATTATAGRDRSRPGCPRTSPSPTSAHSSPTYPGVPGSKAPSLRMRI